MKSKRPNVSEKLKPLHWVKGKTPEEFIGYYRKHLAKSHWQSVADGIFGLLTYYNWGFVAESLSPQLLTEKSWLSKAIPTAFSSSIDPEVSVSYALELVVCASLSNSQDSLATLFDGLDDTRIQMLGHNLDQQALLFRLSNLFRKKPFQDFEFVDSVCKKRRQKISSSTLAAIDALLEGDSTGLQGALKKCISEHTKRVTVEIASCAKRNDVSITKIDLIACLPSAILNIAELRGMKVPEIPEDSLPFMLTRKTLDILSESDTVIRN